MKEIPFKDITLKNYFVTLKDTSPFDEIFLHNSYM